MINLFFVTNDFSGVKTYTNELLAYLKEQREVKLYCIFMESRNHKEYTQLYEDGMVNIYIPWVKRNEKSGGKYAARCMDLIFPLVKGKETVIFHLNHSIHLKLGMEARKRCGAKLIYTLHFLPYYFSWADLNGTISKLTTTDDTLEKAMIREADKIVCVTQFAERTIIRYYHCLEKKIKVIHNGAGNRKIINLTNEQQRLLKIELGFRENDLILLFVGRLERRKGVKHLFYAFNKLCSKYPDIRLVVVGDGNFNETMAFMTENWGRVTFTGNIPFKELKKLYSIAFMGIIPSVYEQCSYAALEMMLYGVPVIVSAAPGLQELFTDRKDSLMVPIVVKEDEFLELKLHEEELSIAIELLLNDPVLRKKLGKNLQAKWEKSYTRKVMGEATLRQYQEISKREANEG
ncbi:MAG: glycosyltransferase [Mangrovibacterium sp.]